MAITQGDWANPERSPEVRAILRDRLQQRVRDFNREHPNPPPSRPFDKINEQIQKAISDAIKEKIAPSRDDVRRAAKEGGRLDFDGDSTCFASLYWEKGIVHAEFQNGYGPYEAPLDLETFIGWTEGSAGKFFNAVLGRDFFAATKSKGG